MNGDNVNLLPYVDKEWIIEQYNKVEVMRLELWDMVYITKERIESSIGKEDGFIDTGHLDSEAIFNNNVLKIVVKDYLPRKCLAKARASQKLLRYKWLKTIIDAIDRLKNDGINPTFEKAHCIIRTYLPRKINWDVDNRVIKFIIDSLRYSRIIADDTADKLSFTVIGEVDKSFPRTEIYVLEHKMLVPMIVKFDI